jgi:hypothetical protein
MKLLAGRGRRDAEDIELLLGACGVGSLARAEELFEACYPNEEIAPRAQALLVARLS